MKFYKTNPKNFKILSVTIGLSLLVFASDCKKDNVEKSKIPHNIEVSQGENIMDIDGNSYPTVIIGTQQWTAANLITTHYANGDSVLYVEDDEVWKDLVTPLLKQGAWCYYENDSTHNFEFGKLYNWSAVLDERNLCPDGWRAPSDDDWHTLAQYLDPDAKIDSVAFNPFSPNIKARKDGIESKVAGGYLKLTGNATNGDGLWREPNVGASNKALFNAKPAGARMVPQGLPRFTALGEGAAFWTTTRAADLPPGGAHFRVLSYDFPYLEQRKIFFSSGMSVRCIKN
jgi:uncharacterized protein (TIGR02145 family)